jgi:hypothetical protein
MNNAKRQENNGLLGAAVLLLLVITWLPSAHATDVTVSWSVRIKFVMQLGLSLSCEEK